MVPILPRATPHRRAGPRLAVAVLALAALAALWSALAARTTVARHWPAAAPLFAAAGLPVNPTGLALASVRSRLSEADGARVLTVEGRIANTGARPAAVPDLTLRITDAQGSALYAWTAPAERPTLPARESLTFKARLASPPRDGQNVVVSFAGLAE